MLFGLFHWRLRPGRDKPQKTRVAEGQTKLWHTNDHRGSQLFCQILPTGARIRDVKEAKHDYGQAQLSKTSRRVRTAKCCDLDIHMNIG